jgi:hypothetical protein
LSPSENGGSILFEMKLKATPCVLGSVWAAAVEKQL